MLEGTVVLPACNTSCKMDGYAKGFAQINTELNVPEKARNAFQCFFIRRLAI